MEDVKSWYEEINDLSYTELTEYKDYLLKADNIPIIEKYIKLAIVFFKMEKLSIATKYFQLVYDTYMLNQKISASEKEEWFDVLKTVYYDWIGIILPPGVDPDPGFDENCLLCCCCGGAVCCTQCCFGGDAAAFCGCVDNCGGKCCCLGHDSCWYNCCGFSCC